jgi:cell division protein FtsL
MSGKTNFRLLIGLVLLAVGIVLLGFSLLK